MRPRTFVVIPTDSSNTGWPPERLSAVLVLKPEHLPIIQGLRTLWAVAAALNPRVSAISIDDPAMGVAITSGVDHAHYADIDLDREEHREAAEAIDYWRGIFQGFADGDGREPTAVTIDARPALRGLPADVRFSSAELVLRGGEICWSLGYASAAGGLDTHVVSLGWLEDLINAR